MSRECAMRTHGLDVLLDYPPPFINEGNQHIELSVAIC